MDKLEPGARVGRWTVLADAVVTEKGERKRHCRCDCGTERYVLERSLKSGASQSCGCRTRENARMALSYDLTGRVFGDLRVVGRSRKRTKMGNYWTCLCRCGYTVDAAASELVAGRRTHCGCQSTNARPISDISGQRFGRLTALWPTQERNGGGSVIWHCRCDCGSETEAAYNDLVYGHQQSCGCQKREHDRRLGTYLTHVAGTSVDMLKSKKLPADNTTGCKGVYRVRGRYLAKIVFQKKQYTLGTYDTLQEAAQARKEAETVLFDGVTDHYAKWKRQADRDPQWARENPIQIQVHRENKKLTLHLLPIL